MHKSPIAEGGFNLELCLIYTVDILVKKKFLNHWTTLLENMLRSV